MKKDESKHEFKELQRRIDELERRITDYRLEEKQWHKRELHIMELIKDRESEIQLLKSLLNNLGGEND